MNTRALKSLCFGPGTLRDQAIGEPIEFIIQARNDSGENRRSGRDIFQVTIKDAKKSDVPCEITDKDNGQYFVKYQVDEEADLTIEVLFQDDKGKMVPVRGSPYSAGFKAGTKPELNHLNGPALPKHVTRTIESTQAWMKEMSHSANTKDKNLDDIKVLISVVDSVKQVQDQNETMMLQLDQLEETLSLLQSQNMSKDSQHKQTKKLQDEWTNLKKLAKDMKKEINPLVAQETSKNNNDINKLEDYQKNF
jgi:hypothetical protein